jgi:ribose-phosphate pyrophosphokinase
MAYDSLMVFTGNANPKLAADVVKRLNISLGRANVGRFSDGEVSVRTRRMCAARHLCPAIDLRPDQRQPDGTDGHGRCAEARLGRPHHRRHPVFRLCPPGSPPASARVAITAKVVANMLQPPACSAC